MKKKIINMVMRFLKTDQINQIAASTIVFELLTNQEDRIMAMVIGRPDKIGSIEISEALLVERNRAANLMTILEGYGIVEKVKVEKRVVLRPLLK